MDRRGLIIGSLVVAAVSVIPNMAPAGTIYKKLNFEIWADETILDNFNVVVSKEWAADLKKVWDIDVSKELVNTLFEFPDSYIHTIVKETDHGTVHMTWTFTPTGERNTVYLEGTGHVVWNKVKLG